MTLRTTITPGAVGHVSDHNFIHAWINAHVDANLILGGFAAAPTSGTWAVGATTIDLSGRTWICKTAGTPGQWVTAGGTILGSGYATADQTGITTVTDITGLSVTFTAPAQTVIIDLFVPQFSIDTAARGMKMRLTDAANSTFTSVNVEIQTANDTRPMRITFPVSGLTYGTSYTFKGRIERLTTGTIKSTATGVSLNFAGFILAIAA